MLLIFKISHQQRNRHPIKYRSSSRVLNDLLVVVKGQQQASEGLDTDCAKAKCAFSSHHWIWLLADTLYKHEFTMRPEILNTQNSTFPYYR